MWTCMLMSYMFSVMLKSFFCFCFQSLYMFTLLWLQLTTSLQILKFSTNFLFLWAEKIATWSQLDGKMCRSWLKVDSIHIRWFCCRNISKVRTTESLFFSVSLDFHSGSFTILRFRCAFPRCIACALSLCWTPFVNYVSPKVWCMERRVDCSRAVTTAALAAAICQNVGKLWSARRKFTWWEQERVQNWNKFSLNLEWRWQRRRTHFLLLCHGIKKVSLDFVCRTVKKRVSFSIFEAIPRKLFQRNFRSIFFKKIKIAQKWQLNTSVVYIKHKIHTITTDQFWSVALHNFLFPVFELFSS